jgi:hypothetical protein
LSGRAGAIRTEKECFRLCWSFDQQIQIGQNLFGDNTNKGVSTFQDCKFCPTCFGITNVEQPAEATDLINLGGSPIRSNSLVLDGFQVGNIPAGAGIPAGTYKSRDRLCLTFPMVEDF